MAALTRGPHSPRVYWTRRLMVLGTAVLLVVAFARLLGGGSDASSPRADDTAVQAAATPTPSTQPPPAVASKKPKQPEASKTPSEPVLADPVGICADEDIAVTPEIDKAVAGSKVKFVVGLRTIRSEACTWHASPESLTLKVTSGKDDIWSSRECPSAVPTKDVVVRRAATTNLWIYWSARRSDDDCSRQTTWALPGWYHVAVSALAGEPSDVQFELEKPEPKVVTKTEPPKGGKNKGGDDEPKHR